MQKTDLKIGVVMATMLEATSFVKKQALQQREKSPFAIFENSEISLIISGVGKANAAAACTYLIITRKLECIYNLGAAGALKEGLPLNTIHHIRKAVEPDRPVFSTGAPFEHTPDMLAGFSTVTLATQDKAVISPENRKQIGAFAELADMEGASVVQVCRYFHMPCYLFKFVSDTPNNHEIVSNIKKYRQEFCLFFEKSILPTPTQSHSNKNHINS